MEARGLANAGMSLLILFMAPLVIVLVYRALTRSGAREPLGIESSPRFQRMEQAIESIAMEVESIAEAQRFTTRILAERHPDSVSRAQGKSLQEPDAVKPH